MFFLGNHVEAERSKGRFEGKRGASGGKQPFLFYSKAKVKSPDGDTLAPFLFIICLDYILRTSIDTVKELGLTLRKSRGRRYPAETITDADYADDLALFANFISETRALLHNLENVAKDIGLHVKASMIKFISFNEQKTRDLNSN